MYNIVHGIIILISIFIFFLVTRRVWLFYFIVSPDNWTEVRKNSGCKAIANFFSLVLTTSPTDKSYQFQGWFDIQEKAITGSYQVWSRDWEEGHVQAHVIRAKVTLIRSRDYEKEHFQDHVIMREVTYKVWRDVIKRGTQGEGAQIAMTWLYWDN